MPVLTATGAGVRRRRRWLFQNLDVTVQPGEIVAVVGPPGSGRTTVLLALARRFKLSAGSVQGQAALAYVPEATSPEPVLTVLEHVRERLLLVGRSTREAVEVPLLGLQPQVKGFELSPYQRHVLGLVLARLENPQVIALDGVDEGLDERESEQLWALLAGLSEGGIAVLVTAREIDPDRVSTLVRLGSGASDVPGAVAHAAATTPAGTPPGTVADAESPSASPADLMSRDDVAASDRVSPDGGAPSAVASGTASKPGAPTELPTSDDVATHEPAPSENPEPNQPGRRALGSQRPVEDGGPGEGDARAVGLPRVVVPMAKEHGSAESDRADKLPKGDARLAEKSVEDVQGGEKS